MVESYWVLCSTRPGELWEALGDCIRGKKTVMESAGVDKDALVPREKSACDG